MQLPSKVPAARLWKTRGFARDVKVESESVFGDGRRVVMLEVCCLGVAGSYRHGTEPGKIASRLAVGDRCARTLSALLTPDSRMATRNLGTAWQTQRTTLHTLSQRV